MFDQLDVASLVPDCYAEYRGIVSEGVMFFLGQLSARRMERILAEQMALPGDADAAQRVTHVLHDCPALHKFGQVLARHRELDGSLRKRLQRLESMVPRTPLGLVRPIIEGELGGARKRYRIRVGVAPLAEASVAVVVPIGWTAPGEAAERRGVLKVLRPGVEADLNEDLEILGRLADYIDERREALGLPAVAYRETFDEVREILVHEVRLRQEQAHLEEARRHFSGWRDVHVPELLPFSTDHVTAMERLEGVKVTELAGHGRRLAETVVRAMVADAAFSREEEALFHGDPHAGNLMATEDGRLGILDWSLTGRLRKRELVRMAEIALGGLMLDARKVARGIEALASAGATEERLRPVVEAAMREARGWRMGVEWLMKLLDGAARAGVRFRTDLLLFRKAFFTLEGVVEDLAGAGVMQRVLAGVMAEELAGEWPRRWVRGMHSTDYGTHVSNAELAEAMMVMPWAMGRWWMSGWMKDGTT